jgi:hypothetical protein
MTTGEATTRAGTGAEALAAVKAAVGWTGPERVDVVERRHVRFYRTAIGLPPDDPGDDAVPPTLVACFLDEPPPMPAAQAYGAGWLNGGDRFEYAAELRLGDELRSRLQFVSVVEKDGRNGTMALLTFVTEFRRPGGELVVRHIGTRIRR